jgi:hypothetical protein
MAVFEGQRLHTFELSGKMVMNVKVRRVTASVVEFRVGKLQHRIQYADSWFI